MADFKRSGKKRFEDSDSDRPRRSFSERRPSFGGRDSDRRDSGRGFSSRGYGSLNSAERGMHSATCAKCGERCQVPFRPTGEKPVLCSDCFRKTEKKESKAASTPPEVTAEDIERINAKLDKIIAALNIEDAE